MVNSHLSSFITYGITTANAIETIWRVTVARLMFIPCRRADETFDSKTEQ